MDRDIAPELQTIWDEAKSYIDQGDFSKAIEIYKYVLIRYGENPVAAEYANAYLGDIYLTLRNLDLAETHIKKAMAYKPGKPGYRYTLGFIYSIQQHWSMAIKEFTMAVKEEPENGEFLRGLGWAVFSKGDKPKGIAYLCRANELAPNNPNILTDLSAAYLSILDFEKAREYGEKALKVNPGSELAKDILEKITYFKRYLPEKW